MLSIGFGPIKLETMKKIQRTNLGPINSKTVVELNADQMNSIKGGVFPIFSIGHDCSMRTKCYRLWTKCWGDTNGELPGGECFYDMSLNDD
ncbi:MAG: hypothetical protein CMP59_07790 [Flavobacteriales bacterium]|nr:hypothetical protein [Flavobacteriales bacterium]